VKEINEERHREKTTFSHIHTHQHQGEDERELLEQKERRREREIRLTRFTSRLRGEEKRRFRETVRVGNAVRQTYQSIGLRNKKAGENIVTM
jgi:hypothetical protein